ncbi:hypothetical protein HPB51_013564 [Rhipicephalus microplus]|uniref:Uncharacterized protein n=1 Tax=Rhipicephalus microplus TaxID=6941 RepID=A0A9J6D9S4_RHIMP|nr:hypothetical protein HPB51_013564 [Rhipicephalus microplus]
MDSVGQVGQPETPGMIKEALAPDRQETFLPSSPCSTGCVPRSAQFVLTASVLSAPMPNRQWLVLPAETRQAECNVAPPPWEEEEKQRAEVGRGDDAPARVLPEKQAEARNESPAGGGNIRFPPRETSFLVRIPWPRKK